MEPLILPAAPEKARECMQIAEVARWGERQRLESDCDFRQRIEECRCRLAILRAVSKRSLHGWQQLLMDDISLNLYRLTCCCNRRCGIFANSPDPEIGTCPYKAGGPLFDELWHLLSDSLKRIGQGDRINREVSRMVKIGRVLGFQHNAEKLLDAR
jgi:hypothetical protein